MWSTGCLSESRRSPLSAMQRRPGRQEQVSKRCVTLCGPPTILGASASRQALGGVFPGWLKGPYAVAQDSSIGSMISHARG